SASGGTDADRPKDARGFTGIEQSGVEDALRAHDVVIRLVVREPHSKIEGHPRSELPRVLDVPRDVLVKVALENLRAGLGVRTVDTQEGVRERVAGVERIGSVVREVDITLDAVLGVARVQSALIQDPVLP